MLNFDELEKGFSEEEALEEARRCLKCKNPLCLSTTGFGSRYSGMP